MVQAGSAGAHLGLIVVLLVCCRQLLDADHLSPGAKGMVAGVNSIMVMSLLFPLEVVSRKLQVGVG